MKFLLSLALILFVLIIIFSVIAAIEQAPYSVILAIGSFILYKIITKKTKVLHNFGSGLR